MSSALSLLIVTAALLTLENCSANKPGHASTRPRPTPPQQNANAGLQAPIWQLWDLVGTKATFTVKPQNFTLGESYNLAYSMPAAGSTLAMHALPACTTFVAHWHPDADETSMVLEGGGSALEGGPRVSKLCYVAVKCGCVQTLKASVMIAVLQRRNWGIFRPFMHVCFLTQPRLLAASVRDPGWTHHIFAYYRRTPPCF